MNEYTLDFLCNFFASQDAYVRNQPVFKSSQVEWNKTRVLSFDFDILGHVFFPKNPEGVDIRLLQFREQIKQGHTFVPTLLVTIRALCIAKTNLSTYSECCAPLLQIWFLKHQIAWPCMTKGFL